jgi:hypothetical protein
MKNYKELREELLEEVSRIDLSKLGLGMWGLSSYVELLSKIAMLPNESYEDNISKVAHGISIGDEVPKKQKGDK